MKTPLQHLKQIFDALEFANVGHLNALTEKLSLHDHGAAPGGVDPGDKRLDDSLENVAGATAPSL